jgi:hypothetical protein
LNNRTKPLHKLRVAGLLPMCRLLESGTLLMDRYMSETHTWHLPCGEMTPTLHDIAYLFGLPLRGETSRVTRLTHGSTGPLHSGVGIWPIHEKFQSYSLVAVGFVLGLWWCISI